MPKVLYTTAKGLYQESGSQVYLPNAFTYKTDTATSDYSDLAYGNHVIMVNAALADTNYIRLPEATTSNGGQVITVVIGVAPADNAYVGFVTTEMVGGATTFSDADAGLMSANNTYVTTTNAKRIVLDADGSTADGCGAPGTVITFYYTGAANKVLVRMDAIGSVDNATLANTFVTTAVNA